MAADQEVNIADLPPAVKATLDQNANGATIGEIELEEQSGQKVYTVELHQNGKEREIMIAPDGKFLGEEAEEKDNDDDGDDDEKETPVEMAKLPEPVRSRILEISKGATIKELKSEGNGPTMVYEAEYDVNGQEQSVKLAGDGSVIEIEKHIAVDALPTTISQVIKQKYPTGTIKEAEHVEEHYISVEVVDGDKEHELKMSPSGAILESETE